MTGGCMVDRSMRIFNFVPSRSNRYPASPASSAFLILEFARTRNHKTVAFAWKNKIRFIPAILAIFYLAFLHQPTNALLYNVEHLPCFYEWRSWSDHVFLLFNSHLWKIKVHIFWKWHSRFKFLKVQWCVALVTMAPFDCHLQFTPTHGWLLRSTLFRFLFSARCLASHWLWCFWHNARRFIRRLSVTSWLRWEMVMTTRLPFLFHGMSAPCKDQHLRIS